jgi:hypothetical protein
MLAYASIHLSRGFNMDSGFHQTDDLGFGQNDQRSPFRTGAPQVIRDPLSMLFNVNMDSGSCPCGSSRMTAPHAFASMTTFIIADARRASDSEPIVDAVQRQHGF